MQQNELIAFLLLAHNAGATLNEVHTYLEAAADAEDGEHGLIECTALERLEDFTTWKELHAED